MQPIVPNASHFFDEEPFRNGSEDHSSERPADCSRLISPAVSSSTSSISTSPPFLQLPPGSSASTSSSLSIDSFVNNPEMFQTQGGDKDEKRSVDPTSEDFRPKADICKSFNPHQSLSPSDWNLLREPLLVLSADQQSIQEVSIQNWLLQQQQQQSQAFQPQNPAVTSISTDGTPSMTPNYAHYYMDRFYSGLGNPTNAPNGPSTSSQSQNHDLGQAQSQSQLQPRGHSDPSDLLVHQRSLPSSLPLNTSFMSSTVPSFGQYHGSSIPNRTSSNVSAANHSSQGFSSSPFNSSSFVDPRILFSSSRDQAEPSLFHRRHSSQNQVQHQCDTRDRLRYRSSTTFASLDQSALSFSSRSPSQHLDPRLSTPLQVPNPIETGLAGEQVPTEPNREPPSSSSSEARNFVAPTSSPDPPSSSAPQTSIVLKGPKGTQHQDLAYDLPQNHTRPPEFNSRDPTKRPIDQSDKIRHAEDRYTPRFVRGSGPAREGFCSLCPGSGKWLRLKSSAYNFHLLYAHGIDSMSGLRFPAPTELRYVYANKSQASVDDPESNPQFRNTEGKCPTCQEWVHLTSGKRKPSFALFYKHMHAHGEVRSRTGNPNLEAGNSRISDRESEQDQEGRGKGKRRKTR